MSPATAAAPTDASLARDAAGGDTGAFEQLYRRHAGRVHGAVLRLVGYDHGRAEELVQEAFVRAWQKLGSFRHESAFGTWLYRLAVNTALMSLRARHNDPLRDSGEELPESADAPPFCPVERDELTAAIGRLPPRARAVLVLHDIEGWKHHEIAEELGMAVGSSKAQLHRARGLLRTALGERS
jgi:RNA polymerase sigma factor (sigma-70 family)